MIYIISKNPCSTSKLVYSPNLTSTTVNSGNISAVLYDRLQSLSGSEKSTARVNIDAIDVSSVNTLITDSYNSLITITGNLVNLNTTYKTNLVGAINEVKAQIGSYNPFTGTSTQFVKADGSFDSNTYLTSNQTITLNGEVSGSGTNSINVTLNNSAILGKVLTGYNVTQGTVVATDSILQAFQKLGYYSHSPLTLGTQNGLSLNNQILSLGVANTNTTGAITFTDWNTFNSKQSAISFTTNGNSGKATFSNNLLNIPEYTAAGIGALTNITSLISSGSNITITGSGTSGSPYVISGSANYSLPTASSTVLGGVKVTQNMFTGLKVDSSTGQLSLSGLIPVVPISETGATTYTLGLSDVGTTIDLQNTTNITIYLSPGLPYGTEINIIRGGTGTVTFSAGSSGEVINSRNGLLSIGHQYAGATLIKTASNNIWYLIGDLA